MSTKILELAYQSFSELSEQENQSNMAKNLIEQFSTLSVDSRLLK